MIQLPVEIGTLPSHILFYVTSKPSVANAKFFNSNKLKPLYSKTSTRPHYSNQCSHRTRNSATPRPKKINALFTSEIKGAHFTKNTIRWNFRGCGVKRHAKQWTSRSETKDNRNKKLVIICHEYVLLAKTEQTFHANLRRFVCSVQQFG